MNQIVKVISAKKKLQNKKVKDDNNNKVEKLQTNEDFAFGYLLAYIKRESDSKILKEKNIFGNSWTTLMDEILDDEADNNLTLTNGSNNTFTPFAANNNSSNSPFGASQLRSPSPVFNLSMISAEDSAHSIGHKNSFQAKAPSPRPPKKMN